MTDKLTEPERALYRTREFSFQFQKMTYGFFIDTWNSCHTYVDLMTKLGIKNKTGLSSTAKRLRDMGFTMKSYRMARTKQNIQAGARRDTIMTASHKPPAFDITNEPRPTEELKAKREIVHFLYYSETQHKNVWRRPPLYRTLDGKVVQATFAHTDEYKKGPMLHPDSVARGQGRLLQPGLLKVRAGKHTAGEVEPADEF